jgi:hypothetical protein
MPEQDITEIDLYRIFKKAIFDVTIELGKPSPVSSGQQSQIPAIPPPQQATSAVEGLNLLIQQAATSNNLLKIMDASLLPKEFTLRGFDGKTSLTPNSPTPLLPTSIKATSWIIQNNGSASISWGSETVQPITIASGGMFLFSFPQLNYVVDLNKTYVKSASASQSYGVVIFQ